MRKKTKENAKAAVEHRGLPAGAPSVVLLALLAVYIGYFTVSTIMRNSIFHDPVSLWRSAVESAPDKRRTHENYGQALSTVGSLNEALEQFKTVLALPDDGSVPPRDVYREIGVVYFRLGLFDDAIVSWKKGLEYAAFDAGLMNNIAIALMRQGHLDEALSYAQTATRSNPYMPEPVNTLGEILMARGDYAKAAEYFERFLQLRPEDSRGYWNTALALERSGDYERAYRFATRFLQHEPDPRYRQAAISMINNMRAKIDAGKK